MEICQIDIYDLSKYEASNKHFKYIFALIDVFTRRAFGVPMKTKNETDVINAFKTILKESGQPSVITSDSDSVFMGSKFQALLKNHNIILDNVIASNDHKALSLIDRFALTLKMIFSRIYLRYDSTNWTSHLKEVLDVYNNSPHSS